MRSYTASRRHRRRPERECRARPLDWPAPSSGQMCATWKTDGRGRNRVPAAQQAGPEVCAGWTGADGSPSIRGADKAAPRPWRWREDYSPSWRGRKGRVMRQEAFFRWKVRARVSE